MTKRPRDDQEKGFFLFSLNLMINDKGKLNLMINDKGNISLHVLSMTLTFVPKREFDLPFQYTIIHSNKHLKINQLITRESHV